MMGMGELAAANSVSLAMDENVYAGGEDWHQLLLLHQDLENKESPYLALRLLSLRVGRTMLVPNSQ